MTNTVPIPMENDAARLLEPSRRKGTRGMFAAGVMLFAFVCVGALIALPSNNAQANKRAETVLPAEASNLGKDACWEDEACETGHCHLGRCVDCESDEDCEGTSICDNTLLGGTYTCTDKRELGDTCFSDDSCASGHCRKTAGCVQCTKDEHCEDADRPICDNVVFKGTFTCIPRRENGETCFVDGACTSGHCHHMAVKNYCVECKEDEDCTDDEKPICSNSLTSGTYTCTPRRPNGETCFFDDSCASGHCEGLISRKCAECGKDEHCPDTHTCLVRECVAKQANGEMCQKDQQCLSGHCDTMCVQCTRHEHCDAGSTCRDNMCHQRQLKPEGAFCLSDESCLSGKCSWFKCQAD